MGWYVAHSSARRHGYPSGGDDNDPVKGLLLILLAISIALLVTLLIIGWMG
jgi:hypothetical protein